MTHALSRLCYLANELRQPLPKQLVRLVPQGEFIQSIATVGLMGVNMTEEIEVEQLEGLIHRGAELGPPNDLEWRTLITQLALSELDDQRDLMTEDDFFRAISFLVEFKKGKTSLIFTEESDWGEEGANIPKWSLGIEPFDLIQHGFYQGVFIIMGPPGSGKTSHMLTFAEGIRKNKMASEIWFYQLELPKPMFQYRIEPLRKRTKFIKNKDRIFYGLRPFSEILEDVRKNPDPERIVFYDSPDVLAAAGGADRRFELEYIYRDLVQLKQYCKAIFVASQPRRKDSSGTKKLVMESVAEAWQKAWYADGIIGVQRLGMNSASSGIYRAAILKNRFGPPDQEIRYNYDLITLEAELRNDSKVQMAQGWNTPDDDW